jgi:hypothetical protein
MATTGKEAQEPNGTHKIVLSAEEVVEYARIFAHILHDEPRIIDVINIMMEREGKELRIFTVDIQKKYESVRLPPPKSNQP